MDEDLNDLKALEGQFAVSRKLTDGTPVTGFAPEEYLAIMQFIGALTRQRRGGGRLATFVEFPIEANPYTTIMLGWWDLLEADANAANKALLWVTTTGAMQAKAKMHAISLGMFQPVQYTTWGDLAWVVRHKPALLSQVLIIGDVDFEPGNDVRKLLSGDGSIGHDEVLAAVRRLSSDPQLDLVLFHRRGWDPAFDADAMLAGNYAVEAKSVAPPPCQAQQENFKREEVIMSARVCGPLLLLPLAYRLVSGAQIDWDPFGVVCVVVGLALVGWGYFTKLPKK